MLFCLLLSAGIGPWLLERGLVICVWCWGRGFCRGRYGGFPCEDSSLMSFDTSEKDILCSLPVISIRCTVIVELLLSKVDSYTALLHQCTAAVWTVCALCQGYKPKCCSMSPRAAVAWSCQSFSVYFTINWTLSIIVYTEDISFWCSLSYVWFYNHSENELQLLLIC